MGSEHGNLLIMGKRFLILLALLLSALPPAFAGPRKIAKELEGLDPSKPVDVIVRYKQAPTASLHNKVLNRGGTLKRELRVIRSGAYSVPASSLGELAADPSVEYIAVNRPVRATRRNPGSWVNDYHAESVNAPAAWAQGLDGSGVGIAVIDSGIGDSPDLNKNQTVYSYDFVTGKAGNAVDQYGHGTHIAGIIAGNGKSSTGNDYFYRFLGIAGGVNLIDLRVLDENGEGSDANVIAAIQKAIALKDKYNIRIINLSLGRDVFESYALDPLCVAVEEAWKAGIAVVVAAGNEGRDNSAGNEGYGTITAPGNDPYVITVGAMNTRGSRSPYAVVPASYSSKGPSAIDHVVKPDLVAPGNLVISLYNPGLMLNRVSPSNQIARSLYHKKGDLSPSNAYFVLSGTSMAAPMVSATAALMLQQDPTLTPDQVKARLMKTTFKDVVPYSYALDQVTGQAFFLESDVFTVGAGYLDIDAALASSDRMPPVAGAAMSPFAGVDGNGDVVLFVNGTSAMWGSTAMWGTSAMWGTRTLARSTTWGTSAMWGTRTLGTSAMWGTRTLTKSTVWGDQSLHGASSGADAALSATGALGDLY